MKKHLLFILLCGYSVCSVAGRPELKKISGARVETIISGIMATVGLKANFEVLTSETYDASATILDGKRYIFYNPDYFVRLRQISGSDWPSVSILAHEIGHHLNGHTLSGSSDSPQIELEADEFSGFVLSKMGATLDEAQQAIKIVSGLQDSKTHPSRTKRLFAIENGWSKAKDKNARGITNEHTTENSSTLNSITNHSVEKTENSETDKLHSIKTESQSNYLRYKVTLHDQPNEIYFLTSQNNLVRFHNNSFFIVGKISKYGKSGFPYIITGNATKYFVSPKGNIVDSDGNAVGYMKIYKS